MITAAQALDAAHAAVKGTAYHDAPSDIAIEPQERDYTVTFTEVAVPSGAARGSIMIRIDGTSRAVRDRQETSGDNRNRQPQSFISAYRAFGIGQNKARELEFEYDERGTTTVILTGDTYAVTFPLPPAEPFTERSDYALRVFVDARTGAITNVLGAA